MRTRTVLQTSIAIALLLAISVLSDSPNLTGDWTYDEKLTEELQPPTKTTRGFGQRLGGYIGGPGGPGAPNPNAASLKQPVILSCEDLKLIKEAETITVTCSDGSHREFHVGNLHGRKTTWKRKGNQLTESYRSTSRSVKHQIKLDKDDNMIVTVTLKPKGGVSQKYVRAFNRVAEKEKKEEDSENTNVES